MAHSDLLWHTALPLGPELVTDWDEMPLPQWCVAKYYNINVTALLIGKIALETKNRLWQDMFFHASLLHSAFLVLHVLDLVIQS